MLPAFEGIQIRHISREANVVTDKLVLLRHHLPTASAVTHLEFVAIVHKDAIGRV